MQHHSAGTNVITSARELEFDRLNTAVTTTFARSGVVCLRGVLDHSWIEFLRDAVEEAIRHPGPNVGGNPAKGFIAETQLWQNHAPFRQFALESPIGRIAAAVMGSTEVRLYNDTMFVKEPLTPEPTPWHHDLPYFNLAGAQNCSVWIGLDPVTQASGAMSFVPGSHRWGKFFAPIGFGQDGGAALSTEAFDGPPPDVDAHPDEYETVSFDLQPGDVTFHHLLTLHKAGANTTAHTRRRAHTMRMAGDDATWIDRAYSTAKFQTNLRHGDRLEGPSFPLIWPA